MLDTTPFRLSYDEFLEAAERVGVADTVVEPPRVNGPVLSDRELVSKIPARLVSNDALVVDEILTLSDIIGGLAESEIPGHTQQILELVLHD
ncbi:MAG: hypothetical protein WBA38_13700 [Gordonia sp. (in: high G+C Gram-positive bacteria)]